MSPPRKTKPLILGVNPRISSPYADPRRGFYEEKVIEEIFLHFSSEKSVIERRADIENSQSTRACITALIESHLIDYAWDGAVNPANSDEIIRLRDASAALLSLLNLLPSEIGMSINFDPRSLKQGDEQNRLTFRLMQDLKSLCTKIDTIMLKKRRRGRPKKEELERMCFQVLALWKEFANRELPMSLRTSEGSAADPALHFVHRIVCILRPNTSVEAVRNQLQKAPSAK